MTDDKTPGKMGRPPVVENKFKQDQFEKLLSMQHTKEECAAWFAFSEKSLERQIKKTYGRSMTFDVLRKRFLPVGTGRLRAVIWTKALKGHPTFARMLAPSVLGFTQKVERSEDPEQLRQKQEHEAALAAGQAFVGALELESSRVQAAAALFALAAKQLPRSTEE